MGASLTHLLRFNDHGEDFLEQIITGDETWVHHYCPETEVQSMAWKHPGSPTIKNQDINQLWESDGDYFGTCMGCFCSTFYLLMKHSILLPLLKKLKRADQRKRPQMSDKRVLLLHDKARPHTTHATVNLLERWGWEILEHPPYSPDLVPSDFLLLPNLKKTSSCQAIQIT